MPSPVTISADDARRLTLRAQGLLGRDVRPRSPGAVLDRLGSLQLDTISVLARSHELVCWSRCGPAPRAAVDSACWGRRPDGSPMAFEYWAHAACILPVELWPVMAFRRRRMRVKRRWALDAPVGVIDEVRDRIAAEGPSTATDLGGAKQGGPWWDWSPAKVAIELLLDWGEVACTTRRGWRRVYDLAERAVPDHLLGDDMPDTACLEHLVGRAGAALGVATPADLADYFRLSRAEVATGLPGSGLVEVDVGGWSGRTGAGLARAWADPDALAALDTGAGRRHRTTLLSPFDPIVWDRARAERVWGLRHRLEAYTPAAERIHGYYAMPVLVGGEIVGRVDPVRRGDRLVARQVGLLRRSAPAVTGTATALREAATWVGATGVDVELVDPPQLRPALVAALG